MKTELKSTTNYDLFEMHEFNRSLHDNKILESSMRKHGFMPSCAIHCVKTTGGKMKVIRGHHRLHYAKRLGLQVWYIIDDTQTDLFDLEGSSTGVWSLRDFVDARAKAGDKGAQKVRDFHIETGIDLMTCCSLVGGESASSNNKQKQVKAGSFKIGNMQHAYEVARVVEHCKKLNVQFATVKPFVTAISAALRCGEVDINTLIHRLDQAAGNMMKRSTRDDYLDELESVYNRGAKTKQIPLAHIAKNTMRKRQLAQVTKKQ
jgi:hypothetical protein